jgi:hypothetical protein
LTHLISRREFTFLSAGAAIAAFRPLQTAARERSAQHIVDVIRQNLGSPWKADGVDGFKAGDPSTTVSGIAVTALPTVDILEKAHSAGLNLVITHEPLFFGRADAPDPQTQAQLNSAPSSASNRPPGVPRRLQPLAADDPVYLKKKELVARYGTVVWRFHDNLLARKENDLAAGLGDALGWTRYRVKGDPALYDIPAATLESIVGDVKKRLDARGGLRVVGDRTVALRRVLLLPGMHWLPEVIDRISDAELTIIGEAREWEVVEYVQDMVTAGQRRGLIMLGRVLSVQPGMRSVASWFAPLAKPLQVQAIANGDLYWRPA